MRLTVRGERGHFVEVWYVLWAMQRDFPLPLLQNVWEIPAMVALWFLKPVPEPLPWPSQCEVHGHALAFVQL